MNLLGLFSRFSRRAGVKSPRRTKINRRETAALSLQVETLEPRTAPALVGPMGVTAVFNTGDTADLAVVNNKGLITIYLGDGSGDFSFASTISAKAGASLAAGDLNNDGNVDLVVSNPAKNSVDIYWGNGNGTFNLTPTDLPTSGKVPAAVVVADFNNDKNLDIEVTNYRTNNISIFLGNGDGTFQSPIISATAGKGPTSTVVTDFDADGNLDLAVLNSSNSTVAVMLGNGDGHFRTTLYNSAGSKPVALTAGLLRTTGVYTGNTLSDLVIANYQSHNVSILQRTSNSFQVPYNYLAGPSKATPVALAVGDFNGDGFADLVVASAKVNSMNILQGDGTGAFSLAQTIPLTTSPVYVVAGNFDNSGGTDFLAIGKTGRILGVWLN